MINLSIIVNNFFYNDSRLHRTTTLLSKTYNLTLFARKTGNHTFADKDNHIDFPVKRFHFRYFNGLTLKMGFLTTILNMMLYFICDIFNQVEMYRKLSNINADIIYSNDCDTLLPAYFASRKKRAKLIYDTHELWSERMGSRANLYMKFKRAIEYIIESLLIRRCNLVITVSDGIADELANRYRIIRPLVIRNLDITRELPDSYIRNKILNNLQIPFDSIIIMSQGILTDSRGIPELIDAIEKLPANYHLILMGEGMNGCLLNRQQNNNRIHYLGMLDEDKLFEYSAICDIGIVPYHTENIYNYFITFPNKFSQFLNAGLAVLFYDSLESRKIVNKCKCGMILEEITSDHIADSIIQISANHKLQLAKENSRKCFLEFFNWDIDRIKLYNAIRRI